MKVKVLTLRWDDEVGGLDDRELEAFMERHAVLEVSRSDWSHSSSCGALLTHPITLTPATTAPVLAAARSFWQASATAQKRSAGPFPVRSASKPTLPDDVTRRLME